MRKVSILVLLLLLLLQVRQVGAAPSGLSAAQLSHGNERRTYWTYLPAGISANAAVPLVFVLHGSAGSGEDMIAITQHGFERIADKEKFVVVYPDALERRWNEQDGTADDVGFLLAIADKLAAESLIDKKRIFIAGISNGGMMAQRLACEHADRIAGLVTVAGTLPEKLAGVCKPARPVPVLVIHGTDDPIVPWNGGPVAGFAEFGIVLSGPETVAIWTANNRCRGAAVTTTLADRDPQDGTRIRMERYADCAVGGSVSLIVVEGGGHTWPGGFQYLPERFIGRTTREIDANQVIWDFFRQVQ